MNENNKKVTSIARGINMNFWLKRFWDVILLDVIILALILASFVRFCEVQVPQDKHVIDRRLEALDKKTGEVVDFQTFSKTNLKRLDFKTLEYIVVDEDKTEYHFELMKVVQVAAVPFAIVIMLQTVRLFFALFEMGSIRRKLKPLNELAKQAEALSSVPLDYTKFENLEHAIMDISPDSPDPKLSTGDSDLRSIEVALNNLLYRMRETQKQQARFVSDASHELRTPISVIQGYANMLDRWGKQDETILEESIEAIKNESDHMKELIEQLLFLARGDNGRNTLNMREFDLSEVMEEVWDESMMIDEKHTYTFKGGIEAPCYGDVAMIKQSARIFIQNAAKYSEEGSTIEISVKVTDDKVSYVIQDNGIGMSGEDIGHIFERFYRSDKARNGKTGGSGLGLSIAKWIIDAHNGTIDVLSRSEIGTRFTIAFPKNIAKNV